MKNKDLKTYNIKFMGQIKVDAFTEDEARSKIEKSNSIKTDGPVKIYSYPMLLAKGFIINIGAIVTMVIAIAMIIAWKQMLDYSQTLPQGLNVIGLFLSFIIILNTARFPQTIGNYLLFKEW